MKKIIFIPILALILFFSLNNKPVTKLLNDSYIKTEKLSVLKDTKDIKSLIEVDCLNNYSLDIDLSYVDMSQKGQYYALVTLTTNNKTYHKIIEIEVIDKVVYLTFDDGPSFNTQHILEILNQYNIKATFFVTAENKEYSYLINETYKQGHTIGLHAYTHDYAYIYASDDNYYKDLDRISNYVEDITGFKSPYLRFPGGSSNTISRKYSKGIMSRITKGVIEKGYQYYDWTLSSSDAEAHTVNKEDIIEKSTSKPYTDNKDYIILLFHDTQSKTTTVEALPFIIEYYLKQG